MTDVHLMTGAYALDSLSATDRAVFQHHLRTCARCRTEVRELRATVAEIGAAEGTGPPAGMATRVMAQIAITSQLPPDAAEEEEAAVPPPMRRYQRREPPLPPPRRSWRTVALLAGAAAVAAVAFGLGSWNAQRAQHPLVVAPADQVTQVVAAPDARMSTFSGIEAAESKVIVAPSMGAAVIMAKNLPIPPEGMVYQAWVMDAGGAKHGMETFVPNPDGAAEAMVHGDFAGATRMEVTVEPMGGSDEPSSAPVAVAALT